MYTRDTNILLAQYVMSETRDRFYSEWYELL